MDQRRRSTRWGKPVIAMADHPRGPSGRCRHPTSDLDSRAPAEQGRLQGTPTGLHRCHHRRGEHHEGLSFRHIGAPRIYWAPKSDDAAAQSLNNFLTALLVVDEKFSIGRLTIVDGPCRDKMLTAYLKFSELRDFANTKLTATRAGFGEFLRRMGSTSNDLDTLMGELVDLAEARLRPARRLLSKRSSINVASNKSEKPKQQSRRRRRDRRGPADSESGQPGGGSPTNFVESTRVAADSASDATEHEAEVMGASQRRRIRTERIKGEQLTPQHIGRFVGQAMGSYNVQSRIVDLIPIGTDPDGSWLMTVHWAALPGQPARWAGTACVSATTSSSSTYYRTRQTRPLTRTHPTSPDLEGSDSPKKARRQCATEAESRQRYAPYTPRGSPARYQACC
jgi:hypothetical protein